MSGQRRVTIFSREYPPVIVGGTSTVARNLAVGLAACGWQVTVISTDPGQGTDRVETDGGVTVYRAATEVVYNRNASLSDASMQIHRRLHRAAARLADEDGAPHAVAVPDLFCYPEASFLARQFSVPLANVLLQDFRTLTAYDRGEHQVTSGVSARAAQLLGLEEKALRGSDHTVFISQALSAAIRQYYPQLPFAGSVVYLGVDIGEIDAVASADQERERLRRELPPAARDRRLVVACGRLVPVKGFDALLRAAALVAAADLHIVIVGVGPEAGRLQQLADQLGLGPSVTFPGKMPRASALTWMSMADVAVVPSLWESFCYVCAEMMALGRPVIATTVDSLNELMPTDEFGYRVAVEGESTNRQIRPELLASALRQALGDRPEAAARAAAAQARIRGEFSNARFGRSMAELLGHLAGARS
jgi:glycogen(starch) synthase